MSLDNQWFSETCEPCGSAFSLKIKSKVHEEQTPFQKIEVYETETFGYLMTIDGFTMVSTRENFLYHEMMTHPVLFTHRNPQQVVIIGGGDCGTLREVLRHDSVERAVQVEIDEQVTRVSERFFPELCEANNDPRAELIFDDGIRWMKEAPAQSLDVIIVDSTDPVGPAEGLFNAAFYQTCLNALKPGGILIQQSESPLLHQALLQQIHSTMKQTGFSATKTLFFPQPIYPSGWWSATMARKEQEDFEFRKKDAENRPFQTRYYNSAVHQGALAQPEFFLDLI